MTLRDQVEATVRATLCQRGGWTERDLADAAIGVVLAAVTQQIEASPQPVDYDEDGHPTRRLADVLAVLARLGGEDAPSDQENPLPRLVCVCDRNISIAGCPNCVPVAEA